MALPAAGLVKGLVLVTIRSWDGGLCPKNPLLTLPWQAALSVNHSLTNFATVNVGWLTSTAERASPE